MSFATFEPPCSGQHMRNGARPLAQMLVENRVSNRTPPVDLPETEFYKLTAQKELSQVGRG